MGGRSFAAVRYQPPPSSQQAYPLDALRKVAVDDDKAQFVAMYPYLRDQILDYLRTQNKLPEESIEWVRTMMDYNAPGGKLNRGITVLTVFRAMKKPATLTTVEVAQAAVCGWVIEFLQAFFLVADDIMDDSQTRRGQPCWYKLPHVRMIAINDGFLLESFVFFLLRQHFAHEPYYYDLLELVMDVTQKTECGQLLDLTSQPLPTSTTDVGTKGQVQSAAAIDLDRFTLQRYQSIVQYKTAYYSFYLPVAMGMLMAGITDRSVYHIAERILLIMGEYFQVQDDFLDCYGDPAVIGKVGTDIPDAKCSWLVVQALSRCNPQQRQILQAHYGRGHAVPTAAEDERRIKALYQELNMPILFAQYEEASYQRIQQELDRLEQETTALPREVFEIFLQKIYKRSK